MTAVPRDLDRLRIPYRVRPGDILVSCGKPTSGAWAKIPGRGEVYWCIAQGDEDLDAMPRVGVIGRG
jgi:hypothetical protein